MAQERDELVATLEVLKRKLEKGSISKEDFEWMSGQVKKRLDALGAAPGGSGPQPTPVQVREDMAELRRIARDQDERIAELSGTVKELTALDSRVREFASMLTGFQELVGLRKELENRMALQEVKVKELLEKTIELEKYDVQALFKFMERLKGIPEEFATKIEMQEARLRQLLERETSLSEVDVKALVEGMNEVRASAQNLVQRVEAQEKALRELYDTRTETLKRSDLEGLLQSLETLREQPKMLEQKLAAQEAALKEIQEKAKMLDVAGQPEKITAVKKTLDEVKRLGIDKLGTRLEAVDKVDEALQDLHRRVESLAKEQELRLAALYKKVEEIPELRSALRKYTAWTAALIEEAKLAPRKLEERMGAVESTLTDFQARVAEIPGAPDLKELKDLAARVKPGIEQLQARMEEVAREVERFKVLADSGAIPDPAELQALRAKAAEAKDQMRQVEESMQRQREEIQKRLGEAQAAVPELAERAAEVAEVTRRLMSLPPGLLERIESIGKEAEALSDAVEQKRGLVVLRASVADLEERLQQVTTRLEEVPPPQVLRTLQQGLSELQGSLFGLERKVEEERLRVVSRFEALQIPPEAIEALGKASALAKDVGDLPARMAALEAKAATAVQQEDLESLDALVGELQELPKKVGKDIEALRGQVKALEAKAATAVQQEDLESLDALVGELQSLPKKMEGDFAAIARRVEALEGAIPALRPEEIAALKSAMEEVRGLPREVEMKIEALGQRLGAVEQAAAGLPRREEVDGLRTLADELKGLPRQFEGKVEALDRKVGALEAASGAAARREEVEALRAAVEEFPKEVEKSVLHLTQRLDSLEKRGQETATRQELEPLREELRALPKEVDALRQFVEEFRKVPKALEKQVEALGRDLEEVRERFGELPPRKELHKALKLVEELKELPRSLEKRFGEVEGRLESLGGKAAALETATASFSRREEVETVRALVEELRALPKEVEKQVASLQGRLGALEEAGPRVALREEVEALRAAVEEARALPRQVEEVLGQRLGALEAQSNRFSTREQVEPLSARVEELGDLAGRLAGLSSELKEARAALEAAATREQLVSVEGRAREMGRRLDGLGTELRKGAEGLRGGVKALEERAATLDRGLDQARARIGELPPAELLKETVEEVEGLKEFPAFAEARFSDLGSSLEAIRSREAAAEKRLDGLGKALEPLRGRLDSVGSKAEEALKGLREIRKFPDEARRRMDGLRSELQARSRDLADLRGRAGALEEAAARFAPVERVAAVEEQVGRIAAESAETGERFRRSLDTTQQVAGLARLAVEAGERTRTDMERWRSELTGAQERLADETAKSISQLDQALRAGEERQAGEVARAEAGWREAATGLAGKAEAWRSEAEARAKNLEGRLGAAADAIRALEERQSQETGRVEAEWRGAVAGLGERVEAWKSEAVGVQARLGDEHSQSLSKLDEALRALQARVEEAQADLRAAGGRTAAAEEKLTVLGGVVAAHGESLEALRAAGAAREAAEAGLRGAVEQLQRAMGAADIRETEGLARAEVGWKDAETRLGQRVDALGMEVHKEQEAAAARFQRSAEEARAALDGERGQRARIEVRLAKAEEAASTIPALKESLDLAAAQFRQRAGSLGEEIHQVQAALDAQRQAGERTAADLARTAGEASGTARGLEVLRAEVARAGLEAAERAVALERRVGSAEGTLDSLRQRADEAATRKEMQAWGATVMEAQKGLQAHLEEQLQPLRRAQKEAADSVHTLESRLKEIPAELQRAASALQQPVERRMEILEGAHRTLRDLGESRFASVDKRLREISDLPVKMEDLGARQEQALDSLHQRVTALREAHQASEQRAAAILDAVEGLRRGQADLARALEAQQARGEEARLALERRLDQFAQQQELALQGLRNLVRASSVDVVEGRVKALEAGQDEVLHHAVTRLRTFEREVTDLRDLVEALFRSRDPASLEVQERRIEGALQELKSQAHASGDEQGVVEARASRLEGLREGLRAWRASQAEADEARRRAEAQERETAAMGALLRTIGDRLKVAEEGFHSMRGSVESTLRGLAETDAKVIEDLADVKGLLGRLVELEASLRRLQAMVETRSGDVVAGLRV